MMLKSFLWFDLYGRMWTLLGDIFCFILCKNEKRYTTLEMMKLYAAMFSITVPGINILLCAWWYVRGARRWNEYVRDL